MKAKLIGGDRHRVEMEVHDGMPVIHFPELKEVEVSFDITASHHPINGACKFTSYRLVKINYIPHTRHIDHAIYCPIGWSDNKLIEFMLRTY